MTKKKKEKEPIDRRAVLKAAGLTSLSLPFVGGLHPWLRFLAPEAKASTAPHRFLQIYCGGGWDSHLCTDPVISGSSKALSGNFQSDYASLANNGSYPTGKSNLKVGPGLYPALSAFQALPTAFVNGIYVEVTAHELAKNYVLSGQLSLSRSLEYPAIIATMGDAVGNFPAHVVLGDTLSLGETKLTNPPLQAFDVSLYRGMLSGAKSGSITVPTTASVSAADTLINALNTNYKQRLGTTAKASLQSWDTSESGLPNFYSQNYQNTIDFTSSVQTDYGFTLASQAGSLEAMMAGGFLTLKSGLTPYVTVAFNGLDTHQNHLTPHTALLNRFATALVQLVTDLQATDDPDDASKKLSDTTTILITSEFVRTPLFNLSAGTDHWQSGSAILMGKGVADNVVLGSTGDDAVAQNYNGDKLLPDHLAATILRQLGFTNEANEVSTENLSALFT